jgi:hypothetical protein
VRVGKSYGFINKDGEMVIEPRYDSAGDFTGGIADVWIGVYNKRKMGYIDKDGKYIWKPQFYKTIYL